MINLPISGIRVRIHLEYPEGWTDQMTTPINPDKRIFEHTVKRLSERAWGQYEQDKKEKEEIKDNLTEETK